MPQAGARAIRQYRHSRRRAAWGAAGFVGSMVVLGGAGALLFSEVDPNGSISSATGAGAFTISGEQPAVVLDGLGNDVAEDCLDFAEVQTGLDAAVLPRKVVEDFAAACALNQLVGPSEASIQKIADRMVALSIDPAQASAGVTRGTAALQPQP